MTEEKLETELDNLREYLINFSLNDLARAFFTLDLWIPNIASPIKMQYLYALLETIHTDLPNEEKLENYEDFRVFYEELFPFLPSFAMLEDYVPETDWGNIKYYFEEKFYKVFYGGDLSNPNDFYYAFEIIHKTFDEEYQELAKRSVLEEMHFCLYAQDYILGNVKQDFHEIENEIVPGNISIPEREFWEDSCNFIEQFSPEDSLDKETLALFTKELNEKTPFPSMETFVSNAHTGKNCQYFFLKKGRNYYPVMPRKWCAVLYDTWGEILNQHYKEIVKNLGKKRPHILIGIQLAKFISERVDNNRVFTLCAPVKDDHTPINDIVFTAIHSKNCLILTYVTPPVFNEKDLAEHLNLIESKLVECHQVLADGSTKLHLASEKEIVEFRSKDGQEALYPRFIIAVPSALSSIMGSIELPSEIDVEIMTLDQVTGIFDEIESVGELSEFFDYSAKERASNRMMGFNSYLDHFGSFKDSDGILVPGAIEPDMIVLDVGWGSNYRYKSLRDFWESFPNHGFWSHPRSWIIPKERKTKTGCILKAKSFFGYYYYQGIGDASIFINTPVNLMPIESGSIADSIMFSLFDAIDLYQKNLIALEFAKTKYRVSVVLFPSHIVKENDELKHVRHLIQDKKPWSVDYARIKENNFGIRIVYNEQMVLEALQGTKDRSVQLSLLIDVLLNLSKIIPDENVEKVIDELGKEKTKEARFGMISVKKIASFPEGIQLVYPDTKEYKIADKTIAKTALKLDVTPGSYDADEARDSLNNLRNELVGIIDAEVSLYDFGESLPILIEKLNALIHDSWQTDEEIKGSLNREVEYERNVRSAEKQKKFIRWARVYRYLVEKFVQLQPNGESKLRESELKELLAFTDRLLELYSSSDFINYQIYPVSVDINRDYLVTIADEENDIVKMEREYGEEQAKINLGLIGNESDIAEANIPIEGYLTDIDDAFKQDFGFGLKNLVNVLQICALWAAYTKQEEKSIYSKSLAEINDVCSSEIIGYDSSETEPILEFLTLQPEEMLLLKGSSTPTNDLPVWEHAKRLMRYDIRPLIKIGGKYCWGSYSMERTARIWIGISSKHKLPSDFNAPNVKRILKTGHENLESSIVNKIEEIVSRHTSLVRSDVFPHSLDEGTADIGDYDVIGYLKAQNILLNIESKIIDSPHSAKDSGRMQRAIYGYTGSDGNFRKGYLQKVEVRDSYLHTHGIDLISKLGWEPPKSDPKVVSIFATKIGYWWTKHPPITTEVNFVEIRLLDGFIKNLES